MTELRRLAMSQDRPRGGHYLTFLVAPEAVEQNQEWSQPVRFKFERHDDGTLTMWLQSLELTKVVEIYRDALATIADNESGRWGVVAHEALRHAAEISPGQQGDGRMGTD